MGPCYQDDLALEQITATEPIQTVWYEAESLSLKSLIELKLQVALSRSGKFTHFVS